MPPKYRHPSFEDKPLTVQPCTVRPGTNAPRTDAPKTNTLQSKKPRIKYPNRRRPRIDLDDPKQQSETDVLLHPDSSAREVQSQARVLTSHLSSDQILTRSACKGLEQAQSSPAMSSRQHKHTASKMTAAEQAGVVMAPKPRPRKRRASSTGNGPQETKRARIGRDRDNGKSDKNFNIKPATKGLSPNSPSPSCTAVDRADAKKSGEAAEATPGHQMPPSKTSFPKTAVGSVEGGGSKTEASTKPAPGASSSKTSCAKSAPSGVECNSKTNVDTESAISGSSSKEASATTAQKSTQVVDSTKTTSPHRAPSPKTASAARGDGNGRGSKNQQRTSAFSGPEESSSMSPPASVSSTEGRNQGEAEVNNAVGAKTGRGERDADNISTGRESSNEAARNGAEWKNQDEAAVNDVEMGEAGPESELHDGSDEEPDKRLVALLGVAVGAGAAALQYFAT